MICSRDHVKFQLKSPTGFMNIYILYTICDVVGEEFGSMTVQLIDLQKWCDTGD